MQGTHAEAVKGVNAAGAGENDTQQRAQIPADQKTSAGGAITSRLLIVMAIASGLAAANLYYNQPLLGLIARSYGANERSVGVLPALSQVGYAVGLLLLVPLGDMLERRRLIITLFGLVAVLLLAAAFAPSLLMLELATLAIGVSTISAQLLLPFAAQLSTPQDRGKNIGAIMSGLLLGILLSRTMSGFVGAHAGWRWMYGIAAILMVVVAAVLRCLLPESRPKDSIAYKALMQSLLVLVREQPLLRESALTGGLAFAAFSAFWATLVFLLSGPAYHLGTEAAGMFGLVGAAGALAAPLVGRWTSSRSPRFLVSVTTLLILISYLIFWGFGATLAGLIVGVILLDVGVQSCHITNQTRVYTLLPDAHSRLNTVYMVTYFIGGALGSYLGALGWSDLRWPGVCLAGAAVTLLSLAAQAFFAVRDRK